MEKSVMNVLAILVGVAGLVQPLVITIFTLGLDRLRIKESSFQISLRTIDVLPTLGILMAVAVLNSFVFVFLDFKTFGYSLFFGLLFSSSFRIRLDCLKGSSTLKRTFLWVIPWYFIRPKKHPLLFLDGWGDWADPEAIYLSFGSDEEDKTWELGWSSAHSGERADKMTDQFNCALTRISSDSF